MSETGFISVNDYLKSRYNEKVYKLALRGGTTCPNRDGTCGYGGCIFCGEGSGSFASDTVDEAILRLNGKSTGSKYIAYFQDFTVTYKMTEKLKERMMETARDERIVTVSVASRPDCLDSDVMNFLKTLNEIKPVWVELGLQTVHEKSAAYINRGYGIDVFNEAVRKLRNAGIDVIVHIILGLPCETVSDMLDSVSYINKMDIQGVKLHMLHILKGTVLGNIYEADKIEWKEQRKEYPFSLEEYSDLICRCINILRKDIVVHRITGDGAKKDLLAPLWSGDKKRVLNTIRRKLQDQD